MSTYLTQEQLMIRETARRYAQKSLAPHAGIWDREEACPDWVIKELGELGLLGMCVPEEYGGTAAGFVASVLAVEELAAGSGGVSTIMHVHSLGSCMTLLDDATEDQKKKYLPRMATGEWIGCMCLTEPQAGSDTSAIRTRAQRDGDHYVLNGTKTFISNGKRAKVAIVIAVTDPEAGRNGITSFIVPTDTPGFNVARLEHKLGQKCSDTAEISLQDCRVPAENILGELNGSYRQILSGLSSGRVSIAMQAVGMARSAYEHALRYAKERVAFGKPIIEHQAIAFKLADMAMNIDIAREYALGVARRVEAGEKCTKEASMAKLFASEMAERVCSDALQIHGGNGYTVDFPVERIYRDVRVCQIYEGPNEIQRLIISRQIANEA